MMRSISSIEKRAFSGGVADDGLAGIAGGTGGGGGKTACLKRQGGGGPAGCRGSIAVGAPIGRIVGAGCGDGRRAGSSALGARMGAPIGRAMGAGCGEGWREADLGRGGGCFGGLRSSGPTIGADGADGADGTARFDTVPAADGSGAVPVGCIGADGAARFETVAAADGAGAAFSGGGGDGSGSDDEDGDGSGVGDDGERCRRLFRGGVSPSAAAAETGTGRDSPKSASASSHAFRNSSVAIVAAMSAADGWPLTPRARAAETRHTSREAKTATVACRVSVRAHVCMLCDL